MALPPGRARPPSYAHLSDFWKVMGARAGNQLTSKGFLIIIGYLKFSLPPFPWVNRKNRDQRVTPRILYFFLGIVLSWVIPLPLAEGRDSIRVLILRDVSTVKVAAEGLNLYDLKTGQPFFKNRKYTALVFEREAGGRVRLRGQNLSAPAFLVEWMGNPLSINGRSYRDQLRVLPGPNRDLWVINVLPLEEYLVGLINFEISSQWPMEAVKAQVIAARTYAFYQRGNRAREPYDVDSGVSDQVYGGTGKEDARSRRAVEETRGELILHQGNAIFSVYSACCGGKTESGEYMWPGVFPYLRSAECAYCLDSPHFLWNYSIDGERLASALGSGAVSGSRILGLEIEERSPSRRVLKLMIQAQNGRQLVSGKDFRRLLGYDQLRSTNFIVKEKDGTFHFSGLGWGHGVGFCQWGAKGMAEAGMDHRAILNSYYRGVEIGKRQR
jgi:stage II sporulation protein D